MSNNWPKCYFELKVHSLQFTVTIFCFLQNRIHKAVIKRRELGFSPGYYECGPWLLSQDIRRKIKPNEIPSCFVPRPLVVFTQQLEILVTSLIQMYILIIGDKIAGIPLLDLLQKLQR